MAYWNPIEFIFLFCDFIAPRKIKVGFCDIDIYGTIHRKKPPTGNIAFMLLLLLLLLSLLLALLSFHALKKNIENREM